MGILIEQTPEKLKKVLKMFDMAQAFEEQRSNPSLQELSFEERLAMGVDREIQARETRKQERLMREAKFKTDACPESFDYRADRGLDRKMIMSLLSCDFIKKGLNVLITGKTGSGKTHVSDGIGHQAVRNGYRVQRIRTSRLVEQIESAHADGSLLKFRNRLQRKDLLILDDWALAPLTEISRQELLEIIDDRLGKSSLIITSQLPVDQWHAWLGEATIADAILDRVVHRAYHIELHGESYRKKLAKEVMQSTEEGGEV